MHIKQVLISGFRSFRSQNEIESFSPKHNVIVGRNGSGKSNFFDAIQFVLLAPKFATLRQEDRQNLLHEGAGSSVMAAYVEIVFDNSDGRFSVESDEVVLRRTVGQKKDEYFLNRKRIQKSEVASLLESAGFSKSNPYYIVQQGKVANLCVMKDKDRLNLLKEVAGTTVYEERRSESIKIMEETASKKGKVEEVLAFIEDRISELEKEKKELIEYEQHDKMRRAIEYTIYDREFVRANEELLSLENDREGLREEQQTLYADLRDVQDEIAQEDDTLNNFKSSMDRLLARKDTLQTDLQQYTTKKSSLEMDIKDLESNMLNKVKNHEEWTQQLQEIQAKISQCQAQLDNQIQPQLKTQHHEMETLNSQFTILDKRRNQLIIKQGRGKQFSSKKERDQFLSEQIQVMQNQYNKKTAMKEQKERSLQQAQQSLHREQQQLQADEAANKQRSSAYDTLSQQIHDQVSHRNALQEQRKTLWRSLEKLQESIVEAKQDLERGKQQLNRTLPRSITQGLATIEMYVQQHRLNGYYGPVIDNFSLKADAFRNAVEVAAGNALFNIIVENDDIAAKLIKELERSNAGRLTFLPLSRLRVQQVRYPESADVRPLIDVAVEYERYLNPAMQLVFGGKLLARDIQTAAHYSKECRMDAITMEGDVVNHRGAFEGGYHDERLSRIAAVMKIREATDKVNNLMEEEERLKHQSSQAEQQINERLRHLQKLESERESLKTLFEQQTRELKQRSKNLQLMSTSIETESSTAQSLTEEMQYIHDQIESYKEEMSTPLKQTLTEGERNELREVEQQTRSLSSEIERLKTLITITTTNRDQLLETLTNSYYKSKEELELKLALHSENHDNDKGGHDYESELIDLRLELQHITLSLQTAQKEYQDAMQIIRSRESESTSIEESLESKRHSEQQIQDRLSDVNKRLDRLFTKRSMLVDTIQARQKQIRDLGTLPRKELEECQHLPDRELMSTLKEVNEELKQYASVNRKALDQYMSFQEQRETLLERKQEMDRDTAAIETLIQNLDLQKDEAILRTFRGVSHHFAEVFSELVPGGQGKLVMRTSMDDDGGDEDVEEIVENTILEEDEEGEMEEEEGGSSSKRGSRGRGSRSSGKRDSKTVQRAKPHPEISTFRGIQVCVQFSGAGQQYQMQQLSGGQKAVVALALIFAIQRCDPAPFYLFDEIDQALDANYRAAVANLIQRQASSETAPAQFITTTFRPELVAVADKCFGISLLNKVSNIHSLEKEDAQEFVSSLMKEDEAVGKVSSVPSFSRSKFSPAAVTEPERDERQEYRRKGRAKQLQRRAEEIEQEGGGDEDEGDDDNVEILDEDEIQLRKLGLHDMEDEDEDEGQMET